MDTPKHNYHITLTTEQGEVIQMWDLKDDIGDVSQSMSKQLLQVEICDSIEKYEKKNPIKAVVHGYGCNCGKC